MRLEVAAVDALALLCTLHADGPATLHRLRAAGVGAIEAVQTVGVEQLGELLGVPAAGARRFLREARHLAERLDADADDEERPLAAALTPRSPRAIPQRDSNAEAAASGRPGRRSERALLDRVLDTWRTTDAPVVTRDPVAQPTIAACTPRAGELVPDAVDGLDAELCAALRSAGIADLASLAQADAMALARTTGIAFTRVTRLRFLARRELDARGTVSTPELQSAPEVAPEAAPRRPANPSEPRPFGEGVGGPFA